MNVVLCGFMGCGKSTIGRLLARETGWSFVDMDQYIENRAGMTVSEIFRRLGEPHFRKLEREAAAFLAQGDRRIIAAGGGALADSENAALLRQTGKIVYLQVPLAVIERRLRNDHARPLFSGKSHEERLALYTERDGLYRAAADLAVSGDGQREEVVHRLQARLREEGLAV